MKTLFDFNFFWSEYHAINKVLSYRKADAKELFNSINCIGKRKKIIQELTKSKLSAIEYLKTKI